MTKIRVAIIGYGHLGKWHAEKVHCFPELATLQYIVEKSEVNRLKARENHPNAIVVSDLDECIDHIDAGMIVTPTSFHFALAKKLLEHNKHVFCEKPVTESGAQGEELLLLAKKTNRIFQVGHSERFHQIWEKVFSDYSKYLDPQIPTYIEIKRVAPFKGRATDVDVVQDLMIHDLDLMVYLLGETPTSVRAQGFKMRTDKFDFMRGEFEFSHGRKASISVGRNQTKEVRSVEMTNPHGVLMIDLMANELFEATSKAEGPNFVSSLKYEKRDHLLLEHKHFYHSITHNEKPIIGIHDGVLAVRLIDRVIESAIKQEAILIS